MPIQPLSNSCDAGTMGANTHRSSAPRRILSTAAAQDAMEGRAGELCSSRNARASSPGQRNRYEKVRHAGAPATLPCRQVSHLQPQKMAKTSAHMTTHDSGKFIERAGQMAVRFRGRAGNGAVVAEAMAVSGD